MSEYMHVSELAEKTAAFIAGLKETDNPATLHLLSLIGVLIIPLGCAETAAIVELNQHFALPPLKIGQIRHYHKPVWNGLNEGKSFTVYDILKHMRNAFAHGSYELETEGNDITQLALTDLWFNDLTKKNEVTFKATIPADSLIQLTQSLLDFFRVHGGSTEIRRK